MDPAVAPDPVAWLAMEELERSQRIKHWHEANPNPILHGGEIFNLDLHASMHAAVETQIAMQDPVIVATTVARLTGEGANRHAVVHAISDVLLRHMHAAMGAGAFDDDSYVMQVGQLDASTIIAQGLKRAERTLRSESGEKPTLNRAQRRAAKKKGKKKR